MPEAVLNPPLRSRARPLVGSVIHVGIDPEVPGEVGEKLTQIGESEGRELMRGIIGIRKAGRQWPDHRSVASVFLHREGITGLGRLDRGS